jgi:O-antigen ligase
VLSVLFSVAGCIYLLHKQKYQSFQLKQFSIETPFLASLIALALILILLNIYHGEKWGTYHFPIAIILSLPAFFIFCGLNFQIIALWIGAAVGSIFAFIVALYEIKFLGAERAGYLINNPIPFGSIAMCLSSFSIIGYREKISGFVWQNALLFCGSLAGFLAAVLSGSKGCLLAVPIIFYLWHKKTTHKSARRASALLILLIFLVLLFFLIQSNSYLILRFTEAYHGAVSWAQSGKITEGSIGPRLELLKFGIEMGQINPWVGIGRNGMLEMLSKASSHFMYDVFITQLHTMHNEFLNIFVTNGLLGLVGLFSVYFFGLKYFYTIRKFDNEDLHSIYLAGLSLFSMYLIFGLSEVTLQLNSFRNFFLIFTVCLVGTANRLRHCIVSQQ